MKNASSKKAKSLGINTILVMLGTLGSRLSGIVRQQMINLFDNNIMDAFIMAIKIPNLLRELLAEGALVNSFIPVYKSLDKENKKEFARSFSGIIIGINLFFVALGVLTAPFIVDILLAQNSNIDRDSVIYMTRLLMPFLMLISLSSIAMGLLNADEHFKESSFAPIAFNIASIVALLVLPQQAFYLAISWLFGGLIQFLVQIPALIKFDIFPKPVLKSHFALKQVFKMMLPFTLTAGARQFLNIYVARLLSDVRFSSGTQAGYANAEAIFTMANGLFVVSPVLAIFPRFAQLAVEKDWQNFSNLTLKILKTICFMAAPISVLLILLADYAASLFNLNGQLPQTRFIATTEILTGWAFALLPWAIVTVLLRTFYARQLTTIAVTISTIGFILEVLIYKFFVPIFGLYGFGLSTCISGVLMSVALFYFYMKNINFNIKEFFLHLLRIFLLVIPTICVVLFLLHFLPPPGQLVSSVFSMMIAGISGIFVYLFCAFLLKMPEISQIVARFTKRSTK